MYNMPFEKIEQYLNGELDAQERLVFESELAANEELASAFNLYRKIENEMRTGKEDAVKTALKENLNQLNKNYFKKSETGNSAIETKEQSPATVLKRGAFNIQNRKTLNINLWKLLAVAASIIGVIALSVIMYQHNLKNNQPVATTNKTIDTSINTIKTDTSQIQKKLPKQNLANENKTDTNKLIIPKKLPVINSTNEKLFADNFKPDEVPENTIGPLEDAFADYAKGDYKNAVASIESADLSAELRGQQEDAKHINFYVHYYKALSYLGENNSVKAIPELRNAVSQSPDSILQIKAQWYLALAYLKSNNTESAEKLLIKIVSENYDSTFKSKAITLLSELKK